MRIRAYDSILDRKIRELKERTPWLLEGREPGDLGEQKRNPCEFVLSFGYGKLYNLRCRCAAPYRAKKNYYSYDVLACDLKDLQSAIRLWRMHVEERKKR